MDPTITKASTGKERLEIPGGTEPKKFGETRYGSSVTMSERMINTKRIYEKLMLDQDYMSWLERQAAKTKEKVRM
jgi:hypothetical protein